MKTLQESLFDKDLVTKESVYSLMDLFKGSLKEFQLTNGLPIHNFFDIDFLRELKSKYGDIILPTKKYKSKYEKHFSIINPFINFIFSNIYVYKTDSPENKTTVSILQKKLDKKCKVPIKVFSSNINFNTYISPSYEESMDNININFEYKSPNGKNQFVALICSFDPKYINITESLFDKDLVTRDITSSIKDDVFFDGQWVARLRKGMSKVFIPIEGISKDNVLEVIDWKKVKKDLKLFGGTNLDLGLYAYANNSEHNIRTVETTKKTEDFARLIMSVPCVEKINFNGYNSRFRDEITPRLNSYILPEFKHKFYFDCLTSKYTFSVVLKCPSSGSWDDLLRFEFEKNI